MVDLAKYTVALEAETAKYRRELERANKKLTSFTRQQERQLDRIRGGFKKAAGGAKLLIAGLSVGVAARFARTQLALGEELENISKQFNVGAAALDEYRLIAERSGIPFNTLTQGMQRLQRRVAEAAIGTGEAQSALEELGLSAQLLSTATVDRQLEIVADAMSRVENESDRVRLAFKLFDSEGVRFLRFLGDGREGLEAIRKELREGGVSLTEDQIKDLSEANQALTEMAQKFTALGNQLVSLATPAINGVTNAIDKMSDALRSIKAGDFKSFFERFNSPIVPGSPLSVLLGTAKMFAPAPAQPPEFSGTVIRDQKPPSTAGPEVEFTKDERLEAANKALEVFFEKNQSLFEFDGPVQDLSSNLDQVLETTEEWAVVLQRAQEKLEEQDRLGERFAETFSENLVQAADNGFKDILRSWVRTLKQMAAKAIGAQIFKGLANTGIGSVISKIFSFDSGGMVPGPRGRPQLALVHGGETILPTHKSSAGLTMNVPVSITGLVTEADVSRAMDVAKADAIRTYRDMRSRGR